MKKLFIILFISAIGCNTPKQTKYNNYIDVVPDSLLKTHDEFWGAGTVTRYKLDKNGYLIIDGKRIDVKADSLGRIAIKTDTTFL